MLLFLTAAALPIVAHQTIDSHAPIQTSNVQWLDQQGRQFYEAEQFAEAIRVWQEAIATITDPIQQVTILSNLALAHQQLGQWNDAEESIQQALARLQGANSNVRSPILAQVLDVQGHLQLSRGQAEAALSSWEQAYEIHTQLGDSTRLIQNQINQTQALRALGFYRRARDQLTATNHLLQDQPDSRLKAIGLRSLGNVLRAIGNLETSQHLLEQSLVIAQTLSDPNTIAETLLSLGNTAYEQQEIEAAFTYYDQAAAIAPTSITRISARLQQLKLRLAHQNGDAEQNQVPQLLTQLLPQIEELTLSRRAIYARIDLAQSLMGLESGDGTADAQVAEMLHTAIQHARALKDLRAEAYALGVLGEVNEQRQQWGEAENWTRQALLLAEGIHAPDIAYRWQWQLGRLLKERGDVAGAIAAYQTAVENLNLIRSDLLSVDSDVQFSFRDDVEPVYRQLVELLLATDRSNEVRQDYLEQAIQQVNALQVRELENFLRCNLAIATEIPQVDATAAILYPVILPNQLVVVLRLPESEKLQFHTSPIAQTEVEQTLDELRQELGRRYVSPEGEALSQQLYDWLVRPFTSALEESKIETLVFVLDGALRNVPMAALHDGQQYLIEQYAIALTPGLQLFAPKPLTKIRLKALTFGLSELRNNFPPHQEFAPLKNVETELQVIQSQIPSQVFLNQEFTRTALQEQISAEFFSVVHLATHGQFSSDPQQTFILAWDGQIDVNTLSSILERRTETSPAAIELLILSACQTAIGDNYATLGLAGIAVRSGVRSTIASLWNIDDQATVELISRFYQELANPGAPITRAEALRRAQIELLQSGYQAPFFWSPYVLVGNWL